MSHVGVLDQRPQPGQRIRVAGGIWFVTEVLQSGITTYTVECVGRRRFYELWLCRSVRDMALNLLLATRPAATIRGKPVMHRDRASRRWFGTLSEDWIEVYLARAAAGMTGETQHGHLPRHERVRDGRDWIDKYLERTRLVRSARVKLTLDH